MHRVRHILTVWILLLLTVRILTRFFPISAPPLLGSYFDLFAVGCTLALVRRNGWDRLLVSLFAIGSLLALEGVYSRADNLTSQGRDISAWFAMLAVAVAFVPFLLFMKQGPDLLAARDAGRITYPLYLIHAHVGYIVLSGMRFHPLLEVFLVAILAIGTAWIIYRLFEEPTEQFRRRTSDTLVGAPIRALLRVGPRRERSDLQ
jgi:peptidoglycan/LPS O-acetylase OafA/YrhL